MQRDFSRRRGFILGVLGVLLVADLALAAYSWSAAETVTSPRLLLERENRQYVLLKADVDRARAMRKAMPSVQLECDQFERALPLEAAGYSAIMSEVGNLARKSGVRLDSVNFRERNLSNRPLTEVQMESAVSGKYSSVMRFVNDLQRSSGLYILDELTLASQNQPGAAGQVRVSLHLRTYFRTA